MPDILTPFLALIGFIFVPTLIACAFARLL